MQISCRDGWYRHKQILSMSDVCDSFIHRNGPLSYTVIHRDEESHTLWKVSLKRSSQKFLHIDAVSYKKEIKFVRLMRWTLLTTGITLIHLNIHSVRKQFKSSETQRSAEMQPALTQARALLCCEVYLTHNKTGRLRLSIVFHPLQNTTNLLHIPKMIPLMRWKPYPIFGKMLKMKGAGYWKGKLCVVPLPQ